MKGGLKNLTQIAKWIWIICLVLAFFLFMLNFIYQIQDFSLLLIYAFLFDLGINALLFITITLNSIYNEVLVKDYFKSIAWLFLHIPLVVIICFLYNNFF